MIAILLTCYNRREKTLKCLESIYAQSQKENFRVYLCDDGSTDGTAENVLKLYPEVHIFKGGNLFWNRGMRYVMKEALKEHHDYYLMVNDDVEFYDTMLKTMLSFNEVDSEDLFAIVGSTQDCCGNISYGGRLCLETPLMYGELLEPNGTLRKCELANWNCFLLPEKVIDKVGLLDDVYQHGFGDYDYCYRLKKNNIPIYVATEYVGRCETNKAVNPLNDTKTSRKKRFKVLFSNKGLPVKSWYAYTKRYGGTKWLSTFIGTYVKNSIKIILNKPMN